MKHWNIPTCSLNKPSIAKPYVLPLEDPDNLDKRHQEIGLGKFQDYISNW